MYNFSLNSPCVYTAFLLLDPIPLSLDDSSGPAKIRRAVEHLRTDVVKGLGVKLLDKVLDIMQEEDEDKREASNLLMVTLMVDLSDLANSCNIETKTLI